MWMGVKARVADLLNQVFVPREMILRANDRVTVIRLPVRTQKLVALAVVTLLGWSIVASGALVIQNLVIAGKNQTIDEHKLAYFELLQEVSEYHQQFAQITQNLESNQAFLLSMLESGAEAEANIAAIEQHLKGSKTEENRVTVASGGLREKLQRFEDDLHEIVGRNLELRSQVASMRDVLSDTEAEKDRVAEAREMLGQRLQEVEESLARVSEEKRQLALTVTELRTDIARSREQLAVAQSVEGDLKGEITLLDSQLVEAGKRRDGLEREIAALQDSLGNAIHRGDGLQGDREDLRTEVAELRQRMVDMRQAQHSIVQRLRDRTELSVDTMERTVAMTGLKLDDLLASIGDLGNSQGGPFVAGDYTGDFDGDAELEIALSLLDLRLSRWSALQRVMRTLPLSVPLEQYQLSSGFGTRTDPINGRKATHRGLDFRAPVKTPVYATAPGKVIFAGWSGPFGRMVEIDHGHGVRTRYAHLKKILVKSGQQVANREKIGLVGSSGRSTGPHLHYEVRYKGVPLNPKKFLTAGKHVFKD
ncbi:peptidoglycan DD-metalloendopeptidase family protein [Pelagibius sp. CAU 1746]|uniref:M23 family metallopeptidase n=1 Tax=Pelagibius sp. CAU 1746 TaxID=3140370 RepID=UPI00325AD249